MLACAALLPDLVTAAASLASPARYGADGLDYFAGMGQDNVDDTRLFLTDEAAARAKTDKDREEMLATSAEDVAKEIESLLTPTDAAVLRGELAGYLVYSMQDGLAPGSQGWWDDNCLVRPWDSTCPTSLSRSCCCMAGRTCSYRSATVNGWPRTFPASRRGCLTTTGT